MGSLLDLPTIPRQGHTLSLRLMLILSRMCLCVCTCVCVLFVMMSIPTHQQKGLRQRLLMSKKGVDDGNEPFAGFVYGKKILNLIIQ